MNLKHREIKKNKITHLPNDRAGMSHFSVHTPNHYGVSSRNSKNVFVKSHWNLFNG